ncbi:hypothetical protein [Gordonia sp. AC31]|uniref:hypothetical protein n=1 Tax=Gordonia sp. AC31 TaxID=2962571 RepID=UPI00288126B3|nr:hypothetical protein [Gordonia sp. AC31]MDT0223489.1 hypothetical protein [Gordonia sp. AC31]
MTDDVRADARRLLQGITEGPWAWHQYGDQYEVFTQDPNTEPGDVADNVQILADAEFIAASPTLVAGLLAELDRMKGYLDTEIVMRDEAEDALRHYEVQRDAANATLARIQAVAADVDQDGGHSGPSLARHILNIIGGDA